MGRIFADRIMHSLEIVNNSKPVCDGDTLMAFGNGCNLDEILAATVAEAEELLEI